MCNRYCSLAIVRKRLARLGKENKLKNPDLSTLEYDDELRLLKWQHGVREFPPKSRHVEKNMTTSSSIHLLGRVSPCLWVALPKRVLIISEKAVYTRRLHLKKAKHTNLTGGGKAYYGGELWFVGKKAIVINGCSGRYGPRSEEQLASAVSVFSGFGWKVNSLGWDREAKRPVKFPR